jgi:cutinase
VATISTFVRRLAACTLAAAGAVGGLVVSPSFTPGGLPSAHADPCPPVEVIFARGRNEAPGPGRLGNAFIDAFRARVPMEVAAYGANYPANTEIAQGANDISSRIQYMAGACPDTRLVVGGYSLGAASAAVALSATDVGFGFKNPLPPDVGNHVAAVVLFANVTRRMGGGGVGPAFRDRVFEACNPEDPICRTGMPDFQNDWGSHLQDSYINGGLVNQAADFAAARVQ